MARTSIGTAYVQIIPSAEGIQGKLTNLFKSEEGEVGEAGKKLGDKLGAGLKKELETTAASVGDAIAAAQTENIGDAGDAGEKLGDKLGAGLKKELETTAASVGDAIAEVETENIEEAGDTGKKLGARLRNMFNSEAGKKLGDKLGAGLKTGLKTTAAVAGAAIAAAGAAIVSIGKQAISSYADFEQLEGGIATLFGNSSNEVMQNAANAFKTAGLSANEYMETVTSFSASLIKGMGGDTEAAAKLADVAITDMADNANKMGSDMESIQNAYNGFAKQNYTMLDNLKLGYGGTKEEMQRLIDDANALNAAQGNMTSYSIDSYADIVSAIHDVQTEMGITGTTAAEAGSTIQGSVSSAKAAWQNWLTALGDSNADVQAKTDDLMNAVGTAMQNILPVAKQVLSSIGEALKTRLPQFLSEAVSFVLESLPEILSLGIELLKALGEGLYQGFAKLLPMVGEWLQEYMISPSDNAVEKFLKIGLKVVSKIIEGIREGWDTLTSWFHNLWDGLFGNLNVNTTVSVSDDTPNGPTPCAKGLDYVPYDEFPAILHKGEAVLTASEAASWRAGGTGNGKVINIYQTIQSVQQTPVQLAAATAAYFERARWAI